MECHLVLGEDALSAHCLLAVLCSSLILLHEDAELSKQVELPEFGIGDFLDWFLMNFIPTVSFGVLLSSISILVHICFLLASHSLSSRSMVTACC